MCLSTVKETYDNPSSLIQSGYKKFNGTGKKLTFRINSKPVEFDKWLVADEAKLKADDYNYYTQGFHVYDDESQVNNKNGYTLVYMRNVHTKGTQTGISIVVAKELYIPSNPKGWPPTSSPNTSYTPSKPSTKEMLYDKIKDIAKGGNA